MPSGPSPARSAPTPPPAAASAWPGRGCAWISPGFHERRELFWRQRAAERGAIAFLGDSITQGWPDLAGAFPRLRVANRGIGGDTTQGALWRLDEDVLALDPAALVVLLGTNDLSLRVDPADAGRNLVDLVAAYDRQRAGRPLVLCRAMPRAYAPCPVDPRRIREINRAIDALGRGRARAVVCDTWGAFAAADGAPRADLFSEDLLHLAPAGYRRWRELLLAAFASLGIGDEARA